MILVIQIILSFGRFVPEQLLRPSMIITGYYQDVLLSGVKKCVLSGLNFFSELNISKRKFNNEFVKIIESSEIVRKLRNINLEGKCSGCLRKIPCKRTLLLIDETCSVVH
jgi:hypothetical protein